MKNISELVGASKIRTRMTVTNILLFIAIMLTGYFTIIYSFNKFQTDTANDYFAKKTKALLDDSRFLAGANTLISEQFFYYTVPFEKEGPLYSFSRIHLKSYNFNNYAEDSSLTNFQKGLIDREEIEKMIVVTKNNQVFLKKNSEIAIPENQSEEFPDNDLNSVMRLRITPAKELQNNATKLKGSDFYYFCTPYMDERGDGNFLIAFYDMGYYKSLRNHVTELIVFVFIVAVVVILVFTNILTTTSLEPLSKLAEDSQKIDLKRPESRLPLPSADDEVRELTKSLNLMLENIENSYKKTRQFTQDASHELRIPLTVIIGNLELMQKYPKESEIYLESFEAVREEADNMKQMIERLLTIARLENDSYVLKPEKFDLGDSIEHLAKELSAAYSREIEFTAPKESTPVVTDKNLLVQMLRSVIDNAIKYSKKKVVVKLETGSKEGSERDAIIKIIDQGIGIPKSEIKEIKSRFYRADNSRNSKSGGTGLGLAICESIATALGGSIDIQSEPNVGTDVTITIYDIVRPAS